MTSFVVNSLFLDFLIYLVYLFCHSAEQIQLRVYLKLTDNKLPILL
ncbi:hypothetical protein [Wolbachia endosymbiont (group A) of Anomoia purmunda]|nr:hypothetical protein [Wolbachia endosymbiont (group A) of Anomoia purmunda]